MEIGRVVGKVWATKKNDLLNGQRFLITKVLVSENQEKEGYLVAADNVGAGVGDMVLITMGSSARISLDIKEVPIDAVIVGIIDSLEVEDE